MNDLKFAFRQLLKTPGFTAVAGLTLALGIGANTAIFSVVNAVLFRRLPFQDADRLVLVEETNARGQAGGASPANFLDWKEQARLLEDFAAKVDWSGYQLTGDPEPEQVRDNQLGSEPKPEVYWSSGQLGTESLRATIVLRTGPESSRLSAAVRKEISALDNRQPVANVQTMEEVLTRSVAPRRFNMTMLGLLACIALLLGVAGIHGVISYSVAQRTHEIGVRMALGAQKANVLSLVIGQGMKLVSLGILIGILGALGMTRVMRGLIYEVEPTDPLTFSGVSLLLITVAVLACWLPARRAADVDPMEALRHE